MTAFIEADLSKVMDFWTKMPERTEEALQLAINDTLRTDGIATLRKDIHEEVNFPQNYLEGERFKVSRFARKGALEGRIKARDRATSLARFASHGQTVGNTRKKGVVVKVKGKGGATHLRKAFLIGLKNGNLGLAVRTSNGQAPSKAYKPVHLTFGGEGSGIWLLYGPSVEQVFKGVAARRADDIGQMVMQKFYRQFSRL